MRLNEQMRCQGVDLQQGFKMIVFIRVNHLYMIKYYSLYDYFICSYKRNIAIYSVNKPLNWIFISGI